MPSGEIQKSLERIEELFDLLQDEIDSITRDTSLAAEDHEDVRLLGGVLYTMSEVKNRFRDIYNGYEEVVNPNFVDPITLANGVTLETKTSTPRSGWKHGELAEVVAERIVEKGFDFDTGELLMEREDMVKELLKYVGVSYWKIKQLRLIGVDPDKFSIPKDDKTTVQITRPREG